MKKIILLLCLILSITILTLPVYAQLQGHTYDLDSSATKKPKTESELISDSEQTADYAIYKGIRYPVYKSKTGKIFIIVKAKTSGNLYRKYIKT